METKSIRFETLAYGYGLIEGPRVDGAGNLYFSDVTNGGVFRRRPDGSIDTVVPKRRGVGGIALHADGGIVISGRNICHVRDGVTRVLFVDDGVPDSMICSPMRTAGSTPDRSARIRSATADRARRVNATGSRRRVARPSSMAMSR